MNKKVETIKVEVDKKKYDEILPLNPESVLTSSNN